MASTQSTSSSGPGNAAIISWPHVISIGPDYLTGGVAFEVFDSNANTAFRTQFDVGDALDAALRMVGAGDPVTALLTP